MVIIWNIVFPFKRPDANPILREILFLFMGHNIYHQASNENYQKYIIKLLFGLDGNCKMCNNN